MKIVIIDSGIQIDHKCFSGLKCASYEVKRNNKDYLLVSCDGTDSIGHGTAIASLLYNFNPDIELISIKIFIDENYNADVETLAFALRSLGILDSDIILMSLGTPYMDNEERKTIETICNDLISKGKIIVSAFDNDGSLSYPAAFKSVIGVDGDPSIIRTTDYDIVYEDDVVDIIARNGVQRVAWRDGGYRLVSGTSFAAAHVVNNITRIIQDQRSCNKDNILAQLSKNARRIIHYERRPILSATRIGRIHNAAIYPYNKEMHALIRFEKDLDFNITNVYDEKKRGMIGRTIPSTDGNKTYVIQPIEDLAMNHNIDTMIIGHCDLIESRIRKNRSKDILEFCLNNNISVYTFDKPSFEVSNVQHKDTWVYWPETETDCVPRWRNGRMWKSTKPVIAVFGTSSRQGKFTVQLYMKYYLEKCGYSIGFLGTEPTSKLFSSDADYPMGYNSNLKWRAEEAILYLNEIMHHIEEKDPDLIIVGSQSGTIPSSISNISDTTLKQEEFLLGTQPDIIILCVNPQDTIEYVMKTVNYLEALSNGEVVATVMLPIYIHQQWSGFLFDEKKIGQEEYDAIRNELYNKSHIPCYRNERGEIELMTEQIISKYLLEMECDDEV